METRKTPSRATISSLCSTLITILLLLLVAFGGTASAQSFRLLHIFSGPDGAFPRAGLSIDRHNGTIYGTTFAGFLGFGWGSAFELRPAGGTFFFNIIQEFDGQPIDRAVIGPDGHIYGTSSNAIFNFVFGYVFSLAPPLRPCRTGSGLQDLLCPWIFHNVYGFPLNGSNGISPLGATLVFDQSGNIYGTTSAGGTTGNGVVYMLTASGTETPIYEFTGSPDGADPYAGVIFDSSGNLYGVTTVGGSSNQGTVFKLTSNGQGGWTEQVIYNFTGGSDGNAPVGGLVFDPSGNLYGSTASGGMNGGGTVFQLTPNGSGWDYHLLYSLTGSPQNCGPKAELSLDSAGNLYGTTYCDGAFNDGNVFKLTNSGGSWTYTSLHDFSGQSDGMFPYSNVSFDAAGKLYGTTSKGSAAGAGNVWQITQ